MLLLTPNQQCQSTESTKPHLEIAGFLVVADEIVLVENGRGRVNEIAAVVLKVRIIGQLVVGNAVQRRRPKHTNIQIRVT